MRVLLANQNRGNIMNIRCWNEFSKCARILLIFEKENVKIFFSKRKKNKTKQNQNQKQTETVHALVSDSRPSILLP